MTHSAHRLIQLTLAVAAGVGCLFISEKVSLTQPQSLVSTADARVGRPLTPMSYAGVARRTTRRAVAAGSVAAPVVVAPVPVRRCVQVVDAYGRIVTRC